MNLTRFLNDRRSDDKNYTHMSVCRPKDYYRIELDDLREMMKLYCDEVRNESNSLFLYERIVDVTPLRLNFDFELEDEVYIEYDELPILSYIIDCVQKIPLQVNDPLSAYCVLLSTSEKTSSQCKFSIHFPYIKLSLQATNKIVEELRNSFKSSDIIDSLSNYLETTINNDWNTILTVNQHLLLYGSRPNDNESKLRLVKCYGPDTEESEINDVFAFGYSLFDSLQDDIDLWLPIMLSTHYYNRTNAIISNVKLENNNMICVIENDKDLSTRFINMLSKRFMSNHNIWLDIGKVLYNVYNGDEEGFNVWRKITNELDMNVVLCNRYYEFNNDNHLSIKTLAWYAKKNNPVEYDKWHKAKMKDSIERAMSHLHSDVAEFIHSYYWLTYTYDSNNKNWYHFNGFRWIVDHSGLGLKNKLSTEVVDYLAKFRHNLSGSRVNSINDRDKETSEKFLQNITDLINKLKTKKYKDDVVSESTQKFYDVHLIEKFDSNARLLGVLNGIIELGEHGAFFREGKPEDYITKHTPVKYQEYEITHQKVIELNRWFDQMFPDKELLCYVLKVFSSCLCGDNKYKIFPILTGEGNNSKSMLKKLFEYTLGNAYCATLPNTLLTGKRTGSSNATPELALLKGARIAFIQETDSSDQLRSGTIKELTGMDTIYVRGLYQKGEWIKATYTFLYMCNRIPDISSMDTATCNRLRIIPFLSTWTMNAPLDPSEQRRLRMFPMDLNFVEKIPELASVFLWVLVRKYTEFIKEGGTEKPPKIVIEYTNRYIEMNDIYKNFWNSNVIISEFETLNFIDAYQAFRAWYMLNFPSRKAISVNEFKDNMIKKFPTDYIHGWIGYSIKRE